MRALAQLTVLLALTLSALSATPTSTYKIIAKYPHSTQSYTEGFFFKDGLFYEGTGLEGHSQILIAQPETGKVVQHVDIPPQYFGEGIVDWGPNLIEWTWQTHIGFVIDRSSLRTVAQFHYTGEGWGMTRTTRELITSDGTSTLRFRNPTDFAETHHILVHDGPTVIDELNELEFVKGEIYANIWHSDRIARISPQDGHVIAWIDLTGILPANQKVNAESVLNGIAYDAKRDRLFVTGKQWPFIFEIKVASADKVIVELTPSRAFIPCSFVYELMKLRPTQIALILALAAVTLTGCRRPEMQRCVDDHNTVVDNDLCQSTGEGRIFGSRLPQPNYRWYFGGTGSTEDGTLAANGSLIAEPDHTYKIAGSPTRRTGLGDTYAPWFLGVAALILLGRAARSKSLKKSRPPSRT